MEKINTAIERRPNYYRGQLLLEGDFLAEQSYHVNARRRHNLNLHGWGVVRGLTVSRAGDNAITVTPGIAITETGIEIFLEQSQRVDLTEFGPNELLRVGFTYEEAAGSEAGAAAPAKWCDGYAVVTVSRISADSVGVTLATVQLDGQGKLGLEAIDYSQTQYVRTVAPGAITPTELHESLRKGWLRVPFRPDPLVNVPQGETEIPPAFRVGATEALSPAHREAGETDRGAAGTMAIPLPPSVTQVTRLRIAGAMNEGEIILKLVVGGWDPNKNEHFRRMIVDATITSEPFLETFDIAETALDPEYHTLSLWLRGTRRTAISLLAIEFAY
jgi:hypothetical protein